MITSDGKTDICSVTGKRFTMSMLRQCRDPAVVKRYGVGGKCLVSYYACQKCRHAVKFEWHGGIACGLEKRVQT